jgi:hypothetical protein
MVAGTSQIELSTGQAIQVEALAGVVAEDQHSSSTEIRSRGGGGYVSSSGGYVSPAQITTVTTTYQQIWITDDHGVDHEVALQNIGIPLRVGQRVTAYLVRPDGVGDGRYEGLFNHSAQRYSLMAPHFKPKIRLTQGYRGSALVTVLVVLALVAGAAAWLRTEQVEAQASAIRSRTPDCKTPPANAWISKSERLAAERAAADCRAHLPEIWAEYRKAVATHSALTRQANVLTFTQLGCAIVLTSGGLIRWVRRSHYRKRVWREYLEKLEAIVGSGQIAP